MKAFSSIDLNLPNHITTHTPLSTVWDNQIKIANTIEQLIKDFNVVVRCANLYPGRFSTKTREELKGEVDRILEEAAA